jgi:hypothetical protein
MGRWTEALAGNVELKRREATSLMRGGAAGEGAWKRMRGKACGQEQQWAVSVF